MYIDLSTEMAISYLMDDQAAKWSPEQARAIVEYYEEIEAESGDPMELDRVAIRCYWTAYTLRELREAYPDLLPDDIESFQNPDDVLKISQILNDHTSFTWTEDKEEILVVDF